MSVDTTEMVEDRSLSEKTLGLIMRDSDILNALIGVNRIDTREYLLKAYKLLRSGGYQHDKAVCIIRTIQGAMLKDQENDAPIEITEPRREIVKY